MIGEAILQRFMPNLSGQFPLRGTKQAGSLAVAQVEQEGLELSRAGRRFHIGFANGVTGIAPVQAIPTTAAQWLIMNNDQNKSLVFDAIGVYLASGTAGAGITLLGGLVGPGTLPTTLPSANAANVFTAAANNASAKSPSVAVVASAQTLAAAPKAGWLLLAENGQNATAVGDGAAMNRDLRGKLIVPPNCGLALVVVSPTGTTPLYVPQGSWAELELDNE